jgi:hypothetical protein
MGAVGQVGQRIVHGEMIDPLFRLLAFPKVSESQNLGLVARILDGAAAELDRNPIAVRRLNAGFRRALRVFLQMRQRARPVVGGEKRFHRPAAQFARGKAEQLLGGGVRVDHAVFAGQQDRLKGGIGKGGEAVGLLGGAAHLGVAPALRLGLLQIVHQVVENVGQFLRVIALCGIRAGPTGRRRRAPASASPPRHAPCR